MPENSAVAPTTLAGDKGLNALLKKGYTYTVSISGERTTLGKGQSVIDAFKLFTKSGTLVYEYANGEEILNEEDLDISAREALKIQKIVCSIYESSRKGEPIVFE